SLLTGHATPAIYTLSLHDALPISRAGTAYSPSVYSYLSIVCGRMGGRGQVARTRFSAIHCRQARPTIESGLSSSDPRAALIFAVDRKSTRLNSSHVKISYAVFCLK